MLDYTWRFISEAPWDSVRKHCNLYPGKSGARCLLSVSYYNALIMLLFHIYSIPLAVFVRILNLCYFDQDVNDVLTAIDFVVDKGLADPNKIAVVGGSHGGFLTTHLIGQVMIKC